MSTVNTPEQPLVITKSPTKTKLVNRIDRQQYLSTIIELQTVLSTKPAQVSYLAFKINTPVGDGFQVPYIVIL